MFHPIPNTPRQVDSKYLNDDLLIVSETQKKVIEENLLSQQAGYILNLDFKNPNKKALALQAVKLLDENKQPHYFVIYTACCLGEGSSGHVNIMQNIETGTWHAIKFNLVNSQVMLQFYMAEVKHLQEIKKNQPYQKISNSSTLITGQLLPNTNKSVSDEYYAISMPIEPGIQMRKFIDNRYSNISMLRWIQFAKSAAQQLKNIHNISKLHRDIKPANMHVLSTGEVKILDYGFTVDATDGTMEDRYWMGTPAFLAPELINTKRAPYQYTTKTDIYSLGKSFAHMFGFTEFQAHERLKEPITRKMVKRFILQMTDKDPNKRPTIEKVEKFFSTIELNALHTLDRFMHIGVLDVNEYKELSENEKENYLQALSTMNEVVLVSNDTTTDKELVTVKNELENDGIQINSQALTLPPNMPLSVETLTTDNQKLYNKIETLNPGKINSYFIISNKEMTQPKNNPTLQIHPLQIKEKLKAKDYEVVIDQQLKHTLLPKQKVDIILASLNQEIIRAECSGKLSSSEFEKRKHEIEAVYNKIKEKSKEEKPLSLGEIVQQLDTLQENLPSHHFFNRVIYSVTKGKYGKSAAAKGVHAIKELTESMDETINVNKTMPNK